MKKKGRRRKKGLSIRLPVAPPSRPHEPKTAYRRQREKAALRREEEATDDAP